ncbi:MAG: hypothetical protein ACFE8N_03505 [Promethearchaeota archaeon]
MIFHDSFFDWHHMMEWDLGHWFGMFFGWVFIILAVFIILYILIHNNWGANQKDQNSFDVSKNESNEIKQDKNIKFEGPNYCFNCGEELDGKHLEYCPNCGVKVKRN